MMEIVYELCLWSVIVHSTYCTLRDFSTCHDDFNLKPPDGILKDHTFTWLGFAQYLHVTTGLPHHSKAPRVILIHKQFAAGTATDLLRLPKNYQLSVYNATITSIRTYTAGAVLTSATDVYVFGFSTSKLVQGNIIFGDYERDEVECGLTRSQTKMGIKCQRAYIEMPIIDISPHPEYTRFGVGNSLALVKLLRPVKSDYMMPICLPSLDEREKKRRDKFVFMVDYLNPVPRDFDSEKMAKKSLKLFTHKDCRRHRMRSNLGSEGVTHVLCSSGCGMRSGAPLVSHATEGAFQLIGIAAGGAPCMRRAMRKRLNREPPLYIDVYPYVPWIINFITGNVLPRAYPENFMLMEGGSSMGIRHEFLRARKRQKSGWRARTFVVGDYCFKSIKKMARTAFFYSETFDVNADPPAKMNIIMKISAGLETTIVCAKLLMPNRLVEPSIAGVGGYNITVSFNTLWFPYSFFFSLGLYGKNTTRRDFDKWIFERKPGFW